MSVPTALDIARGMLDLVLRLIPVTVARDELDQAAIRRQNALADGAEVVKFGPPKGPG